MLLAAPPNVTEAIAKTNMVVAVSNGTIDVAPFILIRISPSSYVAQPIEAGLLNRRFSQNVMAPEICSECPWTVVLLPNSPNHLKPTITFRPGNITFPTAPSELTRYLVWLAMAGSMLGPLLLVVCH